MFPESSSGITLTKIISGLSKSLSIAQQVIPLYEKSKPMITNARNAFSILKHINFNPLGQKSNNIKSTKSTEIVHIPTKKTTFKKSSNILGPVFFK